MKNSERPLRALRRTTPRLMRLEPCFMFDVADGAEGAAFINSLARISA